MSITLCMSNDIAPSNWISKFFNRGLGPRGKRRGLPGTTDLFADFDDIHNEMTRMFDVFNNMSNNAPKELVREYNTKEGDKV